MERRTITGILLVPVIGFLLLVPVNLGMANAIAWAEAGPGAARDRFMLLGIALTLGAVIVAVGGISLVF